MNNFYKQTLTQTARHIGNVGMDNSSIWIRAICHRGIKESNAKFNVVNASNNTSSGSLGPTC